MHAGDRNGHGVPPGTYLMRLEIVNPGAPLLRLRFDGVWIRHLL